MAQYAMYRNVGVTQEIAGPIPGRHRLARARRAWAYARSSSPQSHQDLSCPSHPAETACTPRQPQSDPEHPCAASSSESAGSNTRVQAEAVTGEQPRFGRRAHISLGGSTVNHDEIPSAGGSNLGPSR